jgi:hypothetical protein
MQVQRVLSSLALASLCASASAQTVGSPVIDRPITNGSGNWSYFYRGGTQPLAGPKALGNWSFFDIDANTLGQKVTPLLLEVTGPTQWTVVAIGTPRASTSTGVQTHPFASQAGITALSAGKNYTVGITHRDYSFNAGVATPGGLTGPLVDFSGYGITTDPWSYVQGIPNIGTIFGTGGLPIDNQGFTGRIYSVSFQFGASVPTTYCTPGTTSSGCTATMSYAGSAHVSATAGFQLRVNNVEPNKQGLIFFGVSGRAISPWAPGSSSFLCVKSPTQRMSLLNSNGLPGLCNGAFNIDWLTWLAANPGALGAPFSSGVVVDAQAWFRDPPATKTTNLSNALEFVTAP